MRVPQIFLVCLALIGSLLGGVACTDAEPRALPVKAHRVQGQILALEAPVGYTGSGRAGQNLDPIQYHGGPLMTSMANRVYFIWYGNWAGDSAVRILDDFARNLGGSAFFAINSTYRDQSGVAVPNSLAFAGEIFDSSLGFALKGDDVGRIVENAVLTGNLPLDGNAVYVVLTSGDVSEEGDCTYCGYHYFRPVSPPGAPSTILKYAFVGSPNRCPRSECGSLFGDNSSPNLNSAADRMASIMAHEINESVTDPQITGWFNVSQSVLPNGSVTTSFWEDADKCRLDYEKTYTTSTGQAANAHLGSRDYLLEANWVNGVNGMCATGLTSVVLACVDGVKNGSESDVDCGGADCPACKPEQSCVVNGDCIAGDCTSGRCASACRDTVQDGDEADVDCGGSCPAKCANSRRCHVSNDCQSGYCSAGGCRDGVLCALGSVALISPEQLAVSCLGSSTVYTAVGPSGGPGCPAVSYDTLDAWQEEFESAIFSSTQVAIEWAATPACLNGAQMIQSVRLSASLAER